MHYLIGTDEAGYGPNLGPLVISATVWQVFDDLRSRDLYDRLAKVIVATAAEAARAPAACVAMADSKVLYNRAGGLRNLERGLWVALGLLGRRVETWRGAWRALAPGALNGLEAVPWHSAYDMPLPLDCDRSELESLAATVGAGLAAAGVRLVELHSRAVFPAEFNDLVEAHGSKGTMLTHLTLELAARVMSPLADGPIAVVCDKHGGRNRYAALLAERFPEWLIEVHGEGRQRSEYRFGPPQRRVAFSFQVGAEACLPAALASMASKYLRELAMRALNDYWCGRVANLQPTAGYPQDARRYRAAIAAIQAELQIDDHILWRNR